MQRIEGGAVVTNNAALTDVSALGSLTCMSRGVSNLSPESWGNLYLGSNPLLPSCAAE